MIRTLSRSLATGLTLIFAFSLIGCGGSGGQSEPVEQLVRQTFSEDCLLCHRPGSIRDVAEVHSIATNSPRGQITNVTIAPDGTTTVAFRLFESENPLIPLAGVAASNIRFTVAQLNPGTNGDASFWQSYINTTETAGSVGPGTEDKVQATYEKASAAGGVFTDNGDGTYTYQFSFTLKNVTTPVAVSYNASLTHRVAMQMSGNVDNTVYDFVPDGSAVTETREIAMNASCNECHVRLGFHGDDRISLKYCATCHNPGSADAKSGNTVDLKVMVHKIHYGDELPSVQAGGEYAIWGYGDSKLDYSDVAYPQDIRNCTKCHDGADATTIEGDNWKTVPTREACGSCHDNVDFATGANHDGGIQTDNQYCSACHPADDGLSGVVDSHVIPAQVAAARFEYHITGITNTSPGQFPKVTFSVTDPTNADAAYDILDDPEFTASGGASRLAILIGWDTKDYNNTGSTRTPAQPVSIDPLAAGVAVDNGDGTFSVTSTVAIPSDATGTGVVAIEGHPAVETVPGSGTYNLRVPVKNVFQHFTITDATVVARRQVVDINKCNQCHDNLSLHGNNRTSEPQVCVICHNANATDVDRRPADPTTTADGKAEGTIDFKHMIHAIHAGDKDMHGFRENGIVVYGYGSRANDFSHVRFPGILQNCEACHLSGTFELPLDENVQPTTVNVGDDAAVPDDDREITPVASVCSSCHDSIFSRSHMAEYGGNFDFMLFKSEAEGGGSGTGGPSGEQPPGHSSRTDCSSCHGSQ